MNEQQARVDGLIARIEEHQAVLKLSDVRFVARYQEFIGSSKTWRDRLCARNWTEIDRKLRKWEENLAKLVSLLDGGQEIGEFYEALPMAKYAQRLYDQLQGQTTDRRVGFIVAPTGCGKSWTMKWLARENNKDKVHAIYLYANECWNDSMQQIARSLAFAAGALVDKTSSRRTFDNVTTLLRAITPSVPLTILLDDYQKAGVLGLKLVKSLVDDTRCRFILGLYPTSWNQLIHGSTDALAEAQQIIGRTIKPINNAWLEGLRAEDVAAYMTAAGVKGDIASVTTRVLSHIRRNGGLRLLADAVGLAQSNADERDVAFDALLCEACVYELCGVSVSKKDKAA